MKKPHLLPLLRLCGALSFTAAFAACGGVAASAPAAPTPAPVRASAPAAASSLMQQIQSEIGDASCDTAQQCNTVAIGHKACGGPESYLAWSSKRSDAGKIASLAAAYAAERKAQNLKSGMLSTCSLVVDPGATCSAGHCVPGPAGLGGAQAR